jgi:hypothetical protein
MLSCDPQSNTNVISQSLVTNVLGAHIHPLDKETISHGKEQINVQEVNGYVDLYWCFEENSKRLHNTRFIVTSSQNAPYDAVLGRRDAEHYGMLGSKT